MFSVIFRRNICLVNNLSRSFSASIAVMGKKVAVVLSGCGVYDGAEIHETSACLVHLSRIGAEVKMYAPDVQLDEIDHQKGQLTGAKRSVLSESARIARGAVSDLKDLKAVNYDAVVFPGGFGAAKNLCTFATEGADCKVNTDVERVLKEFHSAKKPVALCCIAPVLAAKVLKSDVTIGGDASTAKAIESMGAKHYNTNIDQFHTDVANKVITAGAFMFGDEAGIHNIFDNVGLMIKKTIELA